MNNQKYLIFERGMRKQNFSAYKLSNKKDSIHSSSKKKLNKFMLSHSTILIDATVLMNITLFTCVFLQDYTDYHIYNTTFMWKSNARCVSLKQKCYLVVQLLPNWIETYSRVRSLEQKLSKQYIFT